MSTRRAVLAAGLATAATRAGARPREGAAVDEYFGVRVEDENRWLEDGTAPAVRAWSEAQNARARRWLDAQPPAAALRAELTRILTRPAARRVFALKPSPTGLFALLQVGERAQPLLVRLPDPERPEEARVVLDVLAVDPAGGVAIDWYEPSPTGERVAVSLSRHGSEQGALHVFDVETGRLLEPPIPNVHNGTAGGDLAWEPDGSGFYYTRYPRPGEVPEAELAFHQKVFRHRLGEPAAADRYELGRGLDRTTEFRLQSQASSGRVLATAQLGDSGQFRFFLREPDGRWRPLGAYGEGHLEARFGDGDDLFLATTWGAPRGRVLRLSADRLDLTGGVEAVPEAADGAALTAAFYDHYGAMLTVSGGRILLVYQCGGPTELRAFSRDGRPLPGPALPPASDVGAVTPLPGGQMLLSMETYTAAPRWLRWGPAGVSRSALTRETEAWDDVEVVRDRARSADGVFAPFTVLRRKGAPGGGPALVYGYGGYRASQTPRFRPELAALLDRGFVYVEANLRGGGEFGEPWHAAGSGARKQNVFDDFIAVVEAVGARHADPRRIVISGASNGGLLVGAVLTQRPELLAGVVAQVGIYDSLRNELDPNGVFNIPEFGSVRDPAQFRTLYAYSPYHQVRRGRRYPPVLFMTGANDPRVNPMHSRKMAARLQDRGRGGPFLLRTSADTGHGYGSPLSARVEELVDAYAFTLAAARGRSRRGR